MTRDAYAFVRNRTRNYGEWTFSHEKYFLFSIVVLFLALSGIILFMNTGRFQEVSNLTPADSIVVKSLNLEPVGDGQVWELDNQVRVYGKFRIIAPSYIESVEIPGQLTRVFVNNTATIDSSFLRTGSSNLVFYWDNVTTDIEIIVSHTDIYYFKLINNGWLVSLSLIAFVLYIPVGSILVIHPSWNYLTKRAYHEELLDIDLQLDDWSEAVERSSRLISHLAGRTDYYRGMRSSLTSIIGILYAACIGLLTFILSTNIDPIVSTPIITYTFLTLVLLTHPVHLLYKSTTNAFLPMTMWFFRGRISSKPSIKESFDFDIDKNLYQIACESEKGLFIDSLREVVSLYYILRNSKNNYSAARNSVVILVFNFMFGFVLAIVALFDIMDFVTIVSFATSILCIIALIGVNLWGWAKTPTTMKISTIFYDPDVLDNRDWQRLYDLYEKLDQDDIRLIPTGKFDLETRKRIWKNTYSSAETSMKRKGLELYPFDGDPESFGSKVTVMIIRRIGRQDELEVYPHYRIDDGKRVLVEAYQYDKR